MLCYMYSVANLSYVQFPRAAGGNPPGLIRGVERTIKGCFYEKRFALKVVLYFVFVGLAFFSPALREYGLSEKVGISFCGAFMCFASASVGRFIAVKIFHCREWDRE